MRALESEKKKEIPAPTQEGSVKDYCGIFSLYAVASGKSVEDIKEKFIQGLLPAYKAEATSCDSGPPSDLIDRLINYEKEQILAGPEQVER
jgi:hypothetical protein